MKHDYLDALKAFEDNRFYDEWDVNFPHKETIIHALRFAEKMMQEPSEGFPSMCQVGAAKIWDECKEGLIGHDQAKAVFTAMRDAALKEMGE